MLLLGLIPYSSKSFAAADRRRTRSKHMGSWSPTLGSLSLAIPVSPMFSEIVLENVVHSPIDFHKQPRNGYDC